jgi:FixJ family two-component response regulator
MNPAPPFPHILVVDDEFEVVDLIRMVLEGAGFQVAGAHDAREALQIFPRHEWAAVITDRKMPHMSGDELREAIRAFDRTTPLVLISGQLNVPADEGLWDAVLPKPFTMGTLRDAVMRACRNKADASGASTGGTLPISC